MKTKLNELQDRIIKLKDYLDSNPNTPNTYKTLTKLTKLNNYELVVLKRHNFIQRVQVSGGYSYRWNPEIKITSGISQIVNGEVRHQEENPRRPKTREEKIEEARKLIAGITLLSTVLIRDLDALLSLEIEDKPFARQKLKQNAKRFLEGLEDVSCKQMDFYSEDLITHMDKNCEVVESYKDLFSLNNLPQIAEMVEQFNQN